MDSGRLRTSQQLKWYHNAYAFHLLLWEIKQVPLLGRRLVAKLRDWLLWHDTSQSYGKQKPKAWRLPDPCCCWSAWPYHYLRIVFPVVADCYTTFYWLFKGWMADESCNSYRLHGFEHGSWRSKQSPLVWRSTAKHVRERHPVSRSNRWIVWPRQALPSVWIWRETRVHGTKSS